MLQIVANTSDLRRLMGRIGRLRRDPTPVWRSMGVALKSITEGNFNRVGAQHRPKPWPPKRDGTPSILQRSTTMVKSFHLRADRKSATVSNATIYAGIHQTGGVIRAKNKPLLRFRSGGRWWSKKSVRIPPRPFFPITDTNRLTPYASKTISRAGARALNRALAGRGRV